MNLQALIAQLREETPAQVKHCVRAVAQKTGDVSRAFAICVAAGQKRGTLKKGTIEPTAKGRKADRTKKKDPDHDAKVGDYETLLTKARKDRSETMSIRDEMLALLEGGDATQAATEKAIMTYLGKSASEVEITDMVSDSSFRGVHFGKVEKSIESLIKQGLVKKTGITTIRKVEAPSNKPADKTPKKTGASPPNVTGEAAPVDDEDPVLKLALEAMQNPVLHHPFE